MSEILEDIVVDVSKMETTTPTREDSSQVGNAAAMREALEALVCVIDKCDSGDPLWWHIGAKGVKPLKDARAALSAPPRNCDVGTTEDQFERFDRWCDSRSIKDCWGLGCRKCLIAWSQMPYEEAKK